MIQAFLKNVVKLYGANPALDGVTLEVRRGEIMTLMGANGAGKTTLLRILAALEIPTRGEVYYKGVRLDEGNIGRLRGQATMVFQQAVMFSTTVYRNIAYGLRLRGLPRGEVDRKVRDAMRLMGLEGYGDRPAKKLSSGEQQRVALARALVLEPEILALDEPTANLDAKNAAVIEEVIKTNKKTCATVLATHNLFQAKRLSDRIAYLAGGKIIEEGTVDEVIERPREEATRKFIRGETAF
ncbi:MAG: phosphate ABC transporter ATP-binding protein [Candidatus Bathyarchaeia archaeon]